MKLLSKLMSVFFSFLTLLGITPSSIPKNVVLKEIREQDMKFSNEHFGLDYENGRFSLVFNGITVFCDAISEYKLSDKTVSSNEYESFLTETTLINDARGSGTEITATLRSDTLPTMKQHFTFYDKECYFLISAELIANDDEVATNYIAPLVIKEGKLQNGNPKWTNFLEVPFDNDNWATFETNNLCESGLSHEVGAFFTPDAKDGLIIGSVTHDTWKSAVRYTNKLASVDELHVYSGANTELTRDQSPHGTVHGKSVSSAVFFVGFYDNWKNGLNEYARLNTTFTPKRKAVTSSNPIGWNSWGSIQENISFSNAVVTSDYIKKNLQNSWQDEDNVVYVNLDSYWDNMSEEELCAFVKHCEENGQIAGIYSSPFVMWWDEEGMKNNCVPSTDIPYNEIRLKKADGTYYSNDIDGCFPLDVTHPATVLHFKNQLEMLMGCGFQYIKLDFLVHGSLEGEHYNKDIQTGIQAYNYAMNEICKIVGDDVFINLSMSPIFPYNYANGRRLSCDTFFDIGSTEYMLNSLTYGFWQSELYDYIDPDHIVLWGKDGDATESEARSRLLSGIITGGSFLAGDNFIDPAGNSAEAFERYTSLLTNEKLIDTLKFGKPFQAVIPTKCPYSADVFTLEIDEKTYIAVFNYSKSFGKTKTIDVPANCTAENLFTAKKYSTEGGKLRVTLRPRDSAIFEIVAA